MVELSHAEEKKLESGAASKNKKGGFWSEVLKFTLVAVIIVVPFRLFIAQPFIVSGASMYPTFEDGEYLIVDQLSFHFEEPARGAVVIFKYPKNPSTFFIKRIIGLPGETLEIKSGVVTIKSKENPDGFVLGDEYVSPDNKKNDNLKVELGDKEFFVMGDNRLGSLDSRSWGPVKENLIIGRPIVRVLPISKATIFPGNYIYAH